METYAMVMASEARSVEDRRTLRRELALRILLQNVLLILVLMVFCGLAGLALLRPTVAAASAAVHGVAVLAAALIWCHHGIRTLQITQFLMQRDDDPEGQGWEYWLRANRPPRLLGSRWLISTKGVFLGLQVAMLQLAWWLGGGSDIVALGAAALLLMASFGFLMTNPKE